MKAGILKMNTIISKIDINNIDKNEILETKLNALKVSEILALTKE